MRFIKSNPIYQFFKTGIYGVTWKQSRNSQIFLGDPIKVVLQRWCFFLTCLMQSIGFIFVFLCVCFCANLFNSELVHGSYWDKEVCYGWILVYSISGRWYHGQESLLMDGARWRVYLVYKDLFMFDVWFFSVDWRIVGISIIVLGYNFDPSVFWWKSYF